MTRAKGKVLGAMTLVGLLSLAACSGANETQVAAEGDGATPDASASGGGGVGYSYTSDQESVETIEGVQFADQGTPEGDRARIAVVLKSLTNQYWQGIEKGVRAAADDFGVDITLQAASSESAQTEQLTIAQTLVGQNFDAYVLAPESTSNLQPALEQIRQQGAPIINVDDARVAATVYVGPDHELDGERAAQDLAEINSDGGPVAQVEGQAGSSAAILRIAGFKAGVADADGLDLVASVPGDWDANKAFGATQQLLQQHPDLVGIYANNDTMAIGVVSALEGAGAADQVAVVGTDGVPEAIAAVRKGAMSATVSPLPYYEGYWAVEAAVRLLRGEDVAPWVVAPAQVITKDNVDQYYDDQGQVITDLYK